VFVGGNENAGQMVTEFFLPNINTLVKKGTGPTLRVANDWQNIYLNGNSVDVRQVDTSQNCNQNNAIYAGGWVWYNGYLWGTYQGAYTNCVDPSVFAIALNGGEGQAMHPVAYGPWRTTIESSNKHTGGGAPSCRSPGRIPIPVGSVWLSVESARPAGTRRVRSA
jgi:hypothetical protein